MVNANKLNGRKIVSAQGEVLGEVDGVDVDVTLWKAAGLLVSLTDDTTTKLGFKKPFLSKVLICLPTSAVASVGEVITLHESVKELKDVVEQVK